VLSHDHAAAGGARIDGERDLRVPRILDEFTGTFFVGVPDVTTLPLLMFNASQGGNYQIASITALLLLVPSIGFMLVVERFLKADVLAMVGR
jgi:putative spermidine/putrescine transport system permease protein